MSTAINSRLRRAAGYGLVGATGIPVDLGVVWLATAISIPGLLASLAGYQVAVTWNYLWQRRYVYRSTASLAREFVRYLGADALGAIARISVVAIILHLAVVPSGGARVVPAAVVASAVGILAGFIATFGAADTLVFDTTQ